MTQNVSGHRNGFLRRGILHRDPSDGNTLFTIRHFDPELAVPRRPEGAGTDWTPMRRGVASDWGAAADWNNKNEWIEGMRHTVSFIAISFGVMFSNQQIGHSTISSQ
jgi:hypothetical protein